MVAPRAAPPYSICESLSLKPASTTPPPYQGITDTQYCLILLNALPASYEVLASTILAAGAPAALKHTEITARILSEEARRSGPSGSSLNAAAKAPIKGKGKGKKRDHSGLTCHYCNKVGHIKPDCHKRKKDEAEEKKKEGSASGSKAANSHVKVGSPSTEWAPLRRSTIMMLALPCMLLSVQVG